MTIQSSCHRDERDFGLETETETRVVSRLVSSFETTCQKSQYQSQNLRLIPKVSVSVSNFETTMQKSQSQSQNAIVGLAHYRFWNHQRKLISCQLFINFYVRMCVKGHINLLFFLKLKVSVSVSMFETNDGLCLRQKSKYQSQFFLPIHKVSVSIFDTKFKSHSLSVKN